MMSELKHQIDAEMKKDVICEKSVVIKQEPDEHDELVLEIEIDEERFSGEKLKEEEVREMIYTAQPGTLTAENNFNEIEKVYIKQESSDESTSNQILRNKRISAEDKKMLKSSGYDHRVPISKENANAIYICDQNLPKIVKCTVCTGEFMNQNYLDKHNKEKHFPCQECDTVFRNQAELTQHVESNHKMDNKYHESKLARNKFLCNLCGKQFMNQAALNEHKKSYHGNA